MNILVTGGAGYIGSHAVRRLMAEGHTPVIVDNLFRGHRESVPAGVRLEVIDINQTEALIDVMRSEKIEGVMHFAALAYVGESVTEPLRYYHNNTAGSVSLLKAMDAAGVKRLVFSSTCATYGQPERMPIVEEMAQSPINPYGWSKLFVERVIRDYAAATEGFGFAALRYFNVAGSATDGAIGEDHEPESHLIPAAILAALGRREKLTVFGTDYPTADGTCVRDYVHVEDLVAAHVRVLTALKGGDARFYNLGTGNGFSVKQIIDTIKEVTGLDVPHAFGARRAGDPATLFADPSKIERELGWRAEHRTPVEMIRTAFSWFKGHPEGYGG